MEEYLQKLVIILPATAIAMGGLLLVVIVYSRSRRKGSESTVPVTQRSVTTQVDGSQQVNSETLQNLVEEAIKRVNHILSEEYRNKQATKISLEEFNNLFSKRRGLDSSGDVDAKQEEPGTLRTPAIAPLDCAPKDQDSDSLSRIHSFASLWVEELQKSGFAGSVPISTERESELLEEEPTPEALPMPSPPPPPPQHSIVISSDSSVAGLETKSRDCITPQLGSSEATYLNTEAKAPNEMKLIHDLESFLLTASLNLCRSVTAFPRAEGETTLNSNPELSIVPEGEFQEHSAEAFSPVASTSMDTPQLLKGGAPSKSGYGFEWRLDIDDASPPNTFKRHRPRSHLCRGVRFVNEDHPPALSLIDLNPDLGYGWRGPDWKETYGKYNVYNEPKGASIYRKPKLHSASHPGVSAYYKSVRAESKRRWEAIKNRTWSEERALERAELPGGVRASAEWRNYLKTLYSNSSSPSESEQPLRIRRVAGRQSGTSKRGGTQQHESSSQANYAHRIKSMLTSSSSSSLESDQSSERTRQFNKCGGKTAHQHCRVLLAADKESSGSSSGGAIE